MKKKEYIQPVLLVVNISNTEVVCTSGTINYGGSNAGTGYNEADASMRRGSDWSDFENY